MGSTLGGRERAVYCPGVMRGLKRSHSAAYDDHAKLVEMGAFRGHGV